MKMIKAVLRPDYVDVVADGLAEAGFVSATKINAFGRGKQKGITVGTVRYDELPKMILLIAVEDNEVDNVLKIIRENAYTGNFGDGKIFISSVERVVTVRTGNEGL
ncbi:MAG: P-II family nitrogen regulator [Planctomycetaceae bacterium]|jgi:nitrogen regulatory protein PII 1|nr:P-II family nitrogen regulator [Planctomycetaceae bacterium]